MPSAPSTDAVSFVHLRDGHIVPVAVLQFAWAMEDAGFRFRVASDGSLQVAPCEQLTPGHLASLRRWKQHVIALVRYCERTDLDAHLRGPEPVTEARIA